MSFNTGNPLPSLDERDFYDNSANLDLAMNSTEPTFRDRFGVEKPTIDAALKSAGFMPAGFDFVTGGTLQPGDRNKAVYNPAPNGDNNWYRWNGAFPKEIAANSQPNPKDENNWVLAELKKTNFENIVNIKDFSSLKEAIDSLPIFGGTVYIPIGNFDSGDWNYNINYMRKDNVSLIGEKMPRWNDDASCLIDGSVISGRFNAYANNFSVENLGFDLGKKVVAEKYNNADTLSANHPLGGTWDAFAFAQPNMSNPLPQRTGFIAKNVISLCKESLSVGHAFLAEGFNGGYIDNVIGIYSIHATVIKAQNVKVGSISGYMASGEGLIIKSDTYAPGGDVQIANLTAARYLPKCTPHSQPSISKVGLYIQPATRVLTGPVQIANIVVKGAENGILADGMIGPDLQFGNVILDGYTGLMKFGVKIGATGAFRRIGISNLICSNVDDAVYYNHPQQDNTDPQLHINAMQVTFCKGIVVTSNGYGRVTIDNLEVFRAGLCYNFATDTSRIYVGNFKGTEVTKMFHNPPGLNSGWTRYGQTGTEYNLYLGGYKACIGGLLAGTSNASSVIADLPTYLKPSSPYRFLSYCKTTTRGYCLIGVDPVAGLVLNEGDSVTLAQQVSLENVSWSY